MLCLQRVVLPHINADLNKCFSYLFLTILHIIVNLPKPQPSSIFTIMGDKVVFKHAEAPGFWSAPKGAICTYFWVVEC